VVLGFGAISEGEGLARRRPDRHHEGRVPQEDALVLQGFRDMGFVAEGGNDALLAAPSESLLRQICPEASGSHPAADARIPRTLERLAVRVERGELQER
jgi:hypothetical protein